MSYRLYYFFLFSFFHYSALSCPILSVCKKKKVLHNIILKKTCISYYVYIPVHNTQTHMKNLNIHQVSFLWLREYITFEPPAK
jgi:hypothetical protein